MEQNHECIIGLFNDYDRTALVTFNELKSLEEYSSFNMKQYCDWRYSTNITRFVYCPFCGKKIDWKNLKYKQS